MKKLLTFIVGAVVGLGAYAQDFDSGGLYYSVLSPDDKTCAVTGYYDVGQDLVIPESVGYDGEEYTVTEIKEESFRWIYLQSLQLPSTLQKIGYRAFWNVNGLSQVVIPNSVKEIGNSSFGACFNLRKLVLGSSVEVINSSAFTECPLSIVVVLGETPARFEYGYSNAITSNPIVAVSENLVAENQAAWDGANVVPNIPAESLSFDPDSYTVQPGGTVQLNYVVYPNNAPVAFINNNSDVITIDDNGLVTADNLKGGFNVEVTATSTNGLTANCSIFIESLTEFESDGFAFVVVPGTENEVALTRYNSGSVVVSIPETVEYNGNVYSVTTIGPDVFQWKEELEEAVIPASVKFIRENNFRYCTSLKKVTIVDSTTPLELSNYDFTDNDNLTELYVGRNLKYSDDSTCFEWIYKLENIVLGPEVTELPAYIFSNCYNLNLVESKNPVPPVLGERAFGYSNPTIIVPAESIEAYRSAWEQYSSYIIDTVDATDLSFETEEITIYNGQYFKLPLVVEPEDATVIWSTSNPDLVRVDKDGYITYESWRENVGEAIITATSLNGLTAECKVTAKHWLTFAENNVSMTPGSNYQVEVTKPEELTDSPITWNSIDPSVADVDQNGEITAVAPGNTEIQATVNVPMDGWEQQFSYSIQVEVRTEVISVEAEDPVISVWKENTAPINLIFNPNDEYVNRKMTWTVADPAIAEVFESWEGNYNVRGLEAGTTTITGTTANGKTVEIEVIVKVPVDRVIFPTDKLFIAPGDSRKLEFTTVPEETNQKFTFVSNNEDIVTVDEDGIVAAHNLGYTEIGVCAETPWGYTNIWWHSVEVCYLPESVTLVGSSDYVGAVNEWTNLQIEYTPNNDDICKEIQWTVDNSEIASIPSWRNPYGFEGNKIGTTAFRGVAANGDVLEGTITINGIMIVVDGEDTYNKNLNLGGEFKLDVEASSEDLLQHLNYYSENPEVATVTENGIVTAVGYGVTNVRVTSSVEGSENEAKYYYDYIQITVCPSEGIILSPNEVTLSTNDWRYIRIIRAENVGWSDVTWTSSDENVVAITWSNGDEAELSYRGSGQATVTATDAYGNVATCEVTCVANIEDLTFNTNRIYVAPGETFQLEYTTVPEITGQSIRFESGNEAVATVDPATGLVTGVEYGRTDIYAVADNGWRWSVPVEVCIIPESVKFAGSSDYEGQVNRWTYFQLEFTPNNDDVCKHIEWTADDPSIVYIDSNDNSFEGRNFGTTAFRGEAANGEVLEGTITINGLKILVDGEETSWKEVTLGDEFKLDVEASSVNLLENLRFTSDNPEVVTVTEDGIVNAVGYGSTYLRAISTVVVNENESKYYEANLSITVKPSEGIVFNTNQVTLSTNQWSYISIIRAENAGWSEVTWASTDENVVAITWSNNNEAQLSYVGPGTATVTATDGYGNVAYCEVTCIAAIVDLIFNTDKIYIAPGETFQLEYTTVPETTEQTITFESGNVDVATVDPETGLVTGVNYGYTYIYAVASNGRWWAVPVQVVMIEEGIEILVDGQSTSWAAMRIGDELKLDVQATSEELLENITFSSDNPEIVTVNEYGMVSAMAVGSTTVRVESTVEVGENEWRTYEASIYITVDYREGLSLDNTEILLTPGSVENINVIRDANVPYSKLTWKSSDENVVDFLWSNDFNAAIVYKGAGRAVITAEDENGYGATCIVTCSGIRISPSEAYMYTNSTLQLDVQVFPETADIESIVWTSKDLGVARVDENGLISSGNNSGVTQITARAYVNGHYSEAVCDVNVAEFIHVTSITLDQTSIKAEVGTAIQLIATVNPENATNKALYWESSDENVATVDEYGWVTIHSEGTAMIVVYSSENPNVSATCIVFAGSGVAGIAAEDTFDIYNLNGILVKKDATAEDYERLEHGIYLLKKGNNVIKVKH